MRVACLSLLIFACIFIGKANAQAGYIITQKNDTIKGEVKIRAFGGPQFKPLNKADLISIDVDTLKEYQLSDSSVFVLRSIPRSTANLIAKPQALQRLEHGRINLYMYQAPAGDHIITWYASKGTDSLITLKTSDIFLVGGGSKKSRKAALSGIFADQPDVQSAFNATGKFDFETIRLYIRKYNRAADKH